MNRLLALVLLVGCSVAGWAQWVKQTSGTDANLRGVQAVTEKICWASGTGGTVLLTTDSGAHWHVMHVPGAEKLDFRDVEAWDAKTAIVMSSGPAEQGEAKIFKTTDGGAHWREVFTTDRKGVFLDSLAFWDNKRGVGLSDPVDGKFVLIATEDGGDSWHFLKPKEMPDALPGEGGFAASGTTIVVAGKHDTWFGTGGAKVSRVFHSSDDGQTWTAAETPIPAGKPSAGIFSLAFRDAMNGFAAGGDYQDPSKVDIDASYTDNGGATWKRLRSGPYVSGFACGPAHVQTAIKSDVSIHLGCNLGVGSGTLLDQKGLNAVSLAPGSDKGWAVGPKGNVQAATCVLSTAANSER